MPTEHFRSKEAQRKNLAYNRGELKQPVEGLPYEPAYTGPRLVSSVSQTELPCHASIGRTPSVMGAYIAPQTARRLTAKVASTVIGIERRLTGRHANATSAMLRRTSGKRRNIGTAIAPIDWYAKTQRGAKSASSLTNQRLITSCALITLPPTGCGLRNQWKKIPSISVLSAFAMRHVDCFRSLTKDGHCIDASWIASWVRAVAVADLLAALNWLTSHILAIAWDQKTDLMAQAFAALLKH